MTREALDMGSITAGYRSIRSGSEYDRYFQRPSNDDKVIIQDGEVTDTVELMKKVVWKYLDDTKRIAPVLKGPTTKATCENLWDFLYHHIQYKLDEEGLEQLRRPARSWAERKSGIDCDCFSIFCSSILTNLQIPHSFRITKYGGSEHFQHVYVVIPDGSVMIKIDPVLDRFDYEKPFSQKRDFPMSLHGIDVAVLSGVPGLAATNDPTDDFIYKHLLQTGEMAAAYPESYGQEFIQKLDYAIKYWNTPQRHAALEALERSDGLLGKVNPNNKFFAALKKVGKGIKSAATAVVKNNPVSVLARTGLMLALKLNLKGMRKKLQWGYASAGQAKAAGISSDVHQRTKVALQKVEHLWTNKLFGKADTLKSLILHRSKGIGQLGVEPVTTAAAITAAAPVIVAVIKILKDSGLFAPNENISEAGIRAELSAQSSAAGYDSGSLMPDPGAGPSGSFFSNNSTLILGAGVLAIGGVWYLRSKKSPKRAALAGPAKPKGKPTPRKATPRKKTTIKKVTLS